MGCKLVPVFNATNKRAASSFYSKSNIEIKLLIISHFNMSTKCISDIKRQSHDTAAPAAGEETHL